MRTLFTARAIVASAAAATLFAGGALPSASATTSGQDDEDTAWVQVCQRIRGDGDHSARDGDDHRSFRGTYRVQDQEDSQRVTLRGRRDCDTVEVEAGRVTVRVVSEPRGTERTSARRFSFRIHEGDTRTVTFRYRIDDDERAAA